MSMVTTYSVSSISFEASSTVFALELNAGLNLLNCKNTERTSYNPDT